MGENSVSSSMRNLWRRLVKLATYQPSPKIINIILVIATIFLISGGIYITFIPAWTVLPYPGGFHMIYPGIYDQTIIEGIAVMIIYALGTVGLMLIYRSTKYRHNPNHASLLIKAGITLFIVALIIVEIIFLQKALYRV